MDGLARVQLIGRIASALQEKMSFLQVKAYLNGFGIDTSRSWSETNSKRVFVEEMLADASPDLVQRIADELHLVDQPEPDTNAEIGEGREYFSHRRAGGRGVLDPTGLRTLLFAKYRDFVARNYFQEAEGFDCVDQGFIPGFMGLEPRMYALERLGRTDIWPPDKDREYSEEDLFDLVEFLYDTVSKPDKGSYHSWGDCGWHGETWDRKAGRDEFRAQVNPLLARFGDGWELTERGEIIRLAPKGMASLLEQGLPTHDPENVEKRVEAAVAKFRRRGTSLQERREAVRALADVFEYLRPEAEKVLATKDEAALFNIANNFAIRHHNGRQKSDYDPAVWLSWMFYFYLATIHAVVHLLTRAKDTAEQGEATQTD